MSLIWNDTPELRSSDWLLNTVLYPRLVQSRCCKHAPLQKCDPCIYILCKLCYKRGLKLSQNNTFCDHFLPVFKPPLWPESRIQIEKPRHCNDMTQCSPIVYTIVCCLKECLHSAKVKMVTSTSLSMSIAISFV